MATLYKKKNSPYWYAQYYDANGNRISKSTRTTKKREAAKIAGSYQAKEEEKKKQGDESLLSKRLSVILEAGIRDANAGSLTLARLEDLLKQAHRTANPSFKEISLSDHLDAWVERQRPRVQAKSIKTYEDMRRRVVAALGQKVARAPVGELRQSDVERAIGKILKQKVKGTQRTITAATVNMDLGALRRALRDAVLQGLATSNPAEDVQPLPKNDSVERAPFTVDEVRKMIVHKDTSDDWKGCILIAAHTGLRLGDVIRLGSDHIKGTLLVIRPEKTKKQRKTLSIPLSKSCITWIGERKGDLFPNLIGRKPGTLSTQFRRIMERASVPRDVTEAGDVVKRRSFHSLRHSFTSWLAEADVHSDVRQKLTGHSSAGVHSRYTHLDDTLVKAVGNLPDL